MCCIVICVQAQCTVGCEAYTYRNVLIGHNEGICVVALDHGSRIETLIGAARILTCDGAYIVACLRSDRKGNKFSGHCR